MFDLTGKKAFVTGSKNGISLALQEALEAAGAEVFMFGISTGYDVTNEDQVRETIRKFDRLDILVNNAGVTGTTWDRTYEVNLKAPYTISLAAREKMSSGGSIINITSINAELAFPGNPQYVAMKHGLKGLTRALALDFGKAGIRVNAIGPGYFRTTMTRYSWENRRKEIEDRTILGRWGQPEDIKGAVVFLASNASSYITGQTIYIDGGWLAKGL